MAAIGVEAKGQGNSLLTFLTFQSPASQHDVECHGESAGFLTRYRLRINHQIVFAAGTIQPGIAIVPVFSLKIHLPYQLFGFGGGFEVNMGRAPPVGGSGLGGGADGAEGVAALGIGGDTGEAGKGRIGRRAVRILRMIVAAFGIGLPDFYFRAGKRLPRGVQHASAQIQHPARGFAIMGQIGANRRLADWIERAKNLVRRVQQGLGGGIGYSYSPAYLVSGIRLPVGPPGATHTRGLDHVIPREC